MVNAFMETLKARQQDAQKRMVAAQQKLAIAQAEFNAVSQEANSWNVALMTETRREQQEAAAAQAATQVGPPVPWTEASQPATFPPAPDVNKTELVRAVLRQHPAGITPTEIWKELKMQVGNAYIYSVLKRLKDREEITKKRGGKYCLKNQPQPEEITVPNGIAQQH
jgi:hypothetical protein